MPECTLGSPFAVSERSDAFLSSSSFLILFAMASGGTVRLVHLPNPCILVSSFCAGHSSVPRTRATTQNEASRVLMGLCITSPVSKSTSFQHCPSLHISLPFRSHASAVLNSTDQVAVFLIGSGWFGPLLSSPLSASASWSPTLL